MTFSYHSSLVAAIQERRKDLIDHRDDSTFSFDPTNLSIKQLNKHSKKHIDTRKGLLLASYGRKKTRKRKKGTEKPKGNNSSGNNNTNNNVKFVSHARQFSYIYISLLFCNVSVILPE